jgi:hypothetical protein
MNCFIIVGHGCIESHYYPITLVIGLWANGLWAKWHLHMYKEVEGEIMSVISYKCNFSIFILEIMEKKNL